MPSFVDIVIYIRLGEPCVVLIHQHLDTSAGGEDDLAVKLDSIVEGCNELCQPTAVAGGNEIALPFQDHDILPAVKRTRLLEANLCKRSPCQVSSISLLEIFS